MSGPAIAPHAAQSAQAAGLIATKFIKPAHATGQAAFDAVLERLASESQPQTGDDVKSGTEDAAKSDAAKDESAHDRSGSGDPNVASDADPAAAIAALVAPQLGGGASAAAIAALLASPSQVNAKAATSQQTSQPTAASVNVQAFGAKASTSAAQAWAARLQAQSQVSDSGGGVAAPSDSTAQIAVSATPTVAPAVVDVHVESARTFLGLDNSAQIAKSSVENGRSPAVDSTTGKTATAAAVPQIAPSVGAQPSAAAKGGSTNAANPLPAAKLSTTIARFVAIAGESPTAPADAPDTVGDDATPSDASVATTPSDARVSKSGDSGGAAAAPHVLSKLNPSRPSGGPAKTSAANGPKAASSSPASASDGSSKAGQQAGGGSTSRDSSNSPFGGAGSNNGASAAGALATAQPGPVAASGSAAVVAPAAAAIGPVSVDQLPDLIADQAATLAGSAPTLAASGATAANLSPVKELKVQLNPADLGSLTVKMRLANGNLAVTIEASKDSTAKMIAGERDAIAGRLASADQPIASITVQASDGVPYQGDNGNGSSATPQQGDAQSSAATGSNGFSGSDGQARPSRDDGGRSEAGRADPADEQTSGRSLTGDLFV